MLENLNPFKQKSSANMGIPQRLMSEEDKEEIKKQKEYEEKMRKIAEEVERVFIREEIKVKDLQKIMNYFNVRSQMVLLNTSFEEIREEITSIERAKEADKATKEETDKGERTNG